MHFDCNPAINLDPQSANAYYNFGVAYAILGDYSNAKADFLEGLKRNYSQDLRAPAEEQLGKLPISF